jgi:hypothetical protein
MRGVKAVWHTEQWTAVREDSEGGLFVVVIGVRL